MRKIRRARHHSDLRRLPEQPIRSRGPSRRGGLRFGAHGPGLGTLIAYSTGPGQVADDNQTGRNGLFTKYLLEQMREPVDVIALFRKTRELVYQASVAAGQRPWVHESHRHTVPDSATTVRRAAGIAANFARRRSPRRIPSPRVSYYLTKAIIGRASRI